MNALAQIARAPAPPELQLSGESLRQLIDTCRSLEFLGTTRAGTRAELQGDVLAEWARLRNVLMWSLPHDRFAGLDL